MESERRSPGADEPAGGSRFGPGLGLWLRRCAVVLVLVGMALTVARTFVTRTTAYPGRRHLSTKVHLNEIGCCLEGFHQREHRLPARLEELRAPGPGCLPEEYLVDGWGNPLVYAVLAPDRFDLRSAGPDGVLGGSGADDDIVWGVAPAGR